MELYFIFLLQIINILISGVMPILSNFFQTITLSECCGLKITRQLRDNIKNSLSNNNLNTNDNDNNLINDNNIIIHRHNLPNTTDDNNNIP
jgi:hypothetical protein